jgi:hypothetical protein
VTKQLLDVAEVGAGFEQVRREAVPEGVGGEAFADARAYARPLHHPLSSPNRSNRYASSGPPSPSYASRATNRVNGSL